MAKATPGALGRRAGRASPRRAPQSAWRRSIALADVPLQRSSSTKRSSPTKTDEVTRLIVDSHDAAAFAPVAHLTVGEFRDWLLSRRRPTRERWPRWRPASRPRWRPRSSKLMRNQDLIAGRAQVPRRHALPQHASACPAGCRCGCSRTTRPTTRAASRPRIARRPALRLRRRGDRHQPGDRQRRRSLDAAAHARRADRSATRSRRSPACWPTSPPRIEAIERGAPVDLVFQSIAGTEAANASFGVDLALLDEAHDAALSLEARHGRRQRHVLRDRPGQRAVGRRPPRRRPADLRGARLRGGARASSRCWSTPSSASSGRSTSTTASRSSAPGWRTTSAASCSACRWAATSATPTTPRPTRTTWTTC